MSDGSILAILIATAIVIFVFAYFTAGWVAVITTLVVLAAGVAGIAFVCR